MVTLWVQTSPVMRLDENLTHSPSAVGVQLNYPFEEQQA